MTADLLSAVEQWCQQTLPAHGPRRGTPPVELLNRRPTVAQLAAHPQQLDLHAYMAGARYAGGEPLRIFPRPLTDSEVEAWLDGWGEHADDAALVATVERAQSLSGREVTS